MSILFAILGFIIFGGILLGVIGIFIYMVIVAFSRRGVGTLPWWAWWRIRD